MQKICYTIIRRSKKVKVKNKNEMMNGRQSDLLRYKRRCVIKWVFQI